MLIDAHIHIWKRDMLPDDAIRNYLEPIRKLKELYGNLFDFDSPILMDIALEAVLEPMRYNIVLVVIPSEGKLTIPGTSGYVEYGYESMPAIPYVFDSGTLYWFDTAEVYSNNSYMSFIGWAFNGVIIIDQYGNVNDEALAMIPVGDDGVIALTAMFQ